MGKIKEVYIEIMEKYDGDIPENFDFNLYLKNRTKSNLSACCQADLSTMINEDLAYEDVHICPKCKEHC